ncbi:helix-turn-helix domain-containing protein [Rhodococcus sp. 11-3]|uniref:helix-turn-helix domain-containing protein n=1 Tax=Rhodococcus sp. 11-3 TaxID=2854796 RepID=UPI00203CF8BA|nr:helix-turn-helix domain-containing protein [Rhodococcus sp. 11-3]USC18457.1 helix-turn-helix domain-containing protein [Rhodococcus sp. 11-3]
MSGSHVRRPKRPTLAEQHAPRVAELTAEGMSCREVAAELGVSPDTVSRAAKLAGATFDRTRTAAATEAAKIDAAARRLALVDSFGAVAAAALDQIVEALAARELEPRQLITLAGVAADKFQKLGPEHDAEAESRERSGQALEDFMDAIRESTEADDPLEIELSMIPPDATPAFRAAAIARAVDEYRDRAHRNAGIPLPEDHEH